MKAANAIDWAHVLRTVPRHLHRSVLRTIPPLSPRLHKGQAGRICVVGGCLEYTGAPFYAAESALRCGADLSLVVCTPRAATAIKSYSPELIVYPYLREQDDVVGDQSTASAVDRAVERIGALLPRLHAVVIGPGLGRDDVICRIVERVLPLVRERGLPVVIDGDGLWLVSRNVALVRGYDRAVLTPNPVEFDRLCRAVFAEQRQGESDAVDRARQRSGERGLLLELCRRLGNVTVVRKGRADMICNGATLDKQQQQQQQQQDSGEHAHDATVLECEIGAEMNRRPGGQGDILAGACGTFAHWALWAAKDAADGRSSDSNENGDEGHLRRSLLVAMYGASLVTKCTGYGAFLDMKRGMTAPDMLARLPHVFEQLYPWRQCGGAYAIDGGGTRGNEHGSEVDSKE